jgi:hypothetical protein
LALIPPPEALPAPISAHVNPFHRRTKISVPSDDGLSSVHATTGFPSVPKLKEGAEESSKVWLIPSLVQPPVHSHEEPFHRRTKTSAYPISPYPCHATMGFPSAPMAMEGLEERSR